MRAGTGRSPIAWGAEGDLVALILLSLLLRVTTFGLSEINWDETAFAVVGREILHGQWPFTTAFDHKPIALYLHFAAAFELLGDNPTVMRILGWVVVTAMALAVRALLVGPVALRRLDALLITSALLVASVGWEGQAVMSEHFVNLYCVLSALFLLRSGGGMAAIAGICAGIAINCNYLAAPIAAGLLAGRLAERRLDWSERVWAILLFMGGALFATALVLCPVFLFSSPSQYFGPQFAFLDAYPVPGPFRLRFTTFINVASPLLPVIGAGSAAIWLLANDPGHQSAERSTSLRPFAGMIAGATVACLTSGYVYNHYLLLLQPPLWLWCGAILSRTREPAARLFVLAALLATSLSIAVTGLLTAGLGAEDLIAKARKGDLTYDQPRQTARIAAMRLPPGGTVYAVSCAPMAVYQLLHVRPPTRYPFYMHVFIPRFAAALGVDPRQEIHDVIAKRPAVFIVGNVDDCAFPEAMHSMIVAAIEAHGYRAYAHLKGTDFFAPGARSES